MNKFKVGDRVRVVRSANFGPDLVLEQGRVYRVISVDEDSINVDNDDGGYSGWDLDRFELVEPAEVEQATAILDGQQDDGWWLLPVTSVEVGGTFIDRDHIRALGLEVRVQARRVQL